jgi:plasmid stabilization system protein ParE
MRSVVWTAPAQADLAAIDDRYGEVAPDFADLAARAALAAGRFLAEHPAAGPLARDFGIRKWRVRGTDYILLYRIVAAGVEIIRVRHVREDWR